MASDKISFWHILWIAPLSIGIAFLLAGCLSDHERAALYVEEGFVVKPIVRTYTTDPDAVCRRFGILTRIPDNTKILACADPYSKIDSRVCTLILPYNPPAWLLHHEELHCLKGSYHGSTSPLTARDS